VRFRAISSSLLLLAYSTLAFAGDFNASHVDDVLEKAKEYERNIELPDVANSEAQQAAEQAANSFYSQEYQKKIQAEIERLKSEEFGAVLDGFEDPTQGDSKDTVLTSNERLYIFISSSVPLSTLRTYAFELHKLNEPNVSMVMRGFVDGMKHFEPTLGLVRSILVTDSDCDLSTEKCEVYSAPISIDPLVFREFGIQRVPAIAYVRGSRSEDAAATNEDPDNPRGPEDTYIVYGDVSLERAIETIAKETKSDGLDGLLRKLRNGFYSH